MLLDCRVNNKSEIRLMALESVLLIDALSSQYIELELGGAGYSEQSEGTPLVAFIDAAHC